MRSWAVGAALVVVASCGRIGFDAAASSDASDASTDTGSAAACDAWGEPELQQMLVTTSEDWEPTLSPDGLRMVFGSLISGRALLYYTERGSTDAPFGPPFVISSLDTGDTIYGPNWQKNGQLLYVHQNVSAHVMLATIGAGNSFTAPTEISDIPAGYDQISIYSDDTEMFTTAYVDLGGGMTDVDFFYSSKTTGSWVRDDSFLPAAANVHGANEYDGWPALDEAHQELLWERAGNDGAGTIYSIKRPSSHEPFDGATMQPLPFSGLTGDPAFDGTGTIMAFTSKSDASDDADIYLTERVCH